MTDMFDSAVGGFGMIKDTEIEKKLAEKEGVI